MLLFLFYLYIPQSKDINIKTDNIANSCKLMHGTSFSNWWTVQKIFSNLYELWIQLCDLFLFGCISAEAEISEILEKVSVSTTFDQSRPVSVSTTIKLYGLEESQSRQLLIWMVSKSLGIDNSGILKSQPVSVSTTLKIVGLATWFFLNFCIVIDLFSILI